MRTAHPAIFIPEPFSFSEDELTSLEQLCNPEKHEQAETQNTSHHKHGPNFRVRRAQIEDVEVLDAPYYEEQLGKPKESADDGVEGSPVKHRAKRSMPTPGTANAAKRHKALSESAPGGWQMTTPTPKRVSFVEPASSAGVALMHTNDGPDRRRGRTSRRTRTYP